jgi:HAE1 family hydrophobic/amphiphilic exporter-1
MAGGISGPFIRLPIATSLLMVGILFVGIIAYPQLPVAPLPEVDFPTIQVSASLPGADPETMASSVAQPLESQFALIPGVSEMTSQSQTSSTQIVLQFDLSRNIDGAGSDVRAPPKHARAPGPHKKPPAPPPTPPTPPPPPGSCPRICRARRPTGRSIRPTLPFSRSAPHRRRCR